MSRYYTDNLEADVERHLDDEDAYHAALLECDFCDGKITDDSYYNVNGVIICRKCMEECRRYV